MSWEVDNFLNLLPSAVSAFWSAREEAAKKQELRGRSDQGNRSAVIAGAHLVGFENIVKDLVILNVDNHKEPP